MQLFKNEKGGKPVLKLCLKVHFSKNGNIMVLLGPLNLGGI